MLQLNHLLAILGRHGVDFVVVGGIAGSAHGSAYATFDLDIAYSRDDANLIRLAAALDEMRAALRGGPADLPFQWGCEGARQWRQLHLHTDLGSFDALGDIEGIRDYESLRAASNVEHLAEVAVRIASIDHLIAMKRAANRPKDRLAVEEYILIADQQKKLAKEKKEKG